MWVTDLELGKVGDVGAAAHVIVDLTDLNDSDGALVALWEASGARLEHHNLTNSRSRNKTRGQIQARA